MTRRRQRQKPRFICDRTGLKFPMAEAVVEPGTGLRVHFLESDGMYSLVEHPQNKPFFFKDEQDPLPNATPNDIDGGVVSVASLSVIFDWQPGQP